jgi:endoribonuclease Dicer
MVLFFRTVPNIYFSDELSVDKYSARIEVEMPQFLIGKYSASHQHDVDPWPILLQQDVVIVPSTVS